MDPSPGGPGNSGASQHTSTSDLDNLAPGFGSWMVDVMLHPIILDLGGFHYGGLGYPNFLK